MEKITINREQKLYVIPCGQNGFSCYGFDVLDKKIKNLCIALQIENICKRKGTLKAYNFYTKLVNIARKSGRKFEFDLYKPFIGNEGKRVEITYKWGEKERGIIGKSTGFIPIHILLKRVDSLGGDAILKDSIESYRFI